MDVDEAPSHEAKLDVNPEEQLGGQTVEIVDCHKTEQEKEAVTGKVIELANEEEQEKVVESVVTLAADIDAEKIEDLEEEAAQKTTVTDSESEEEEDGEQVSSNNFDSGVILIKSLKKRLF